MKKGWDAKFLSLVKLSEEVTESEVAQALATFA